MKGTVNQDITFELLVCEIADTMQVERGDTIYQPGSVSSTVYVVKEGRIKLAYLDESGKKLTLAMVSAGGIFGEMCLVGEKHRRHLATAIEDSLLYSVPTQTLSHVMGEDPQALRLLLGHFADRLREFEETLEDLAFRDIQARLSRQLLKLSDEYGVKTDEGILIGFQLTHKELADMIGSARENTTLALNRFAREGILDKSRYRIVIKNEKGLRAKMVAQN